MAKGKKKGIYSKVVVAFIIVANVIFTAFVLRAFEKTGSEPAVLIGSWFTFTTVELVSLANITIKKSKENNKGDQS